MAAQLTIRPTFVLGNLRSVYKYTIVPAYTTMAGREGHSDLAQSSGNVNENQPSSVPVFFRNKRIVEAENGRRISAGFSGSGKFRQLEKDSWRNSRSGEDIEDMDEKIVKLLSLSTHRLPKSCDPLTYCFWSNGLHRRFETVCTNNLKSLFKNNGNALVFTVCSYNVLCQRTLGYYVEKLYRHCPFEFLTWQRRWPLLAVELQMLDADVFCLQEVQYDHFESDYLPFFKKLGYEGVFKKKLRKRSDGCATFWRSDKFKPLQIHPVEYSFPAPHEHSDNVALMTVLEPIGPGQRGVPFVVANTHLIYQPAYGATKLCQAALLLAHSQQLTKKYSTGGEDASLILCGDFNCTPYSPLYSLMVEGQLYYEGLNGWAISGQNRQKGHHSIGDAILGNSLLSYGLDVEKGTGRVRHELGLKSVYDDREGQVTTFLPDQAFTVDYIFYTGKADKGKEDQLQCLERYRLPPAAQLDRMIGFLPNQYCASDHLPIMAKFALE